MLLSAGERISMQDIFQKDAPEGVRALYRKHARGNSLFHNIRFRDNSNDGFQDVSESTGVEVGRWSWSSDAWDFDHDGFPDLYIANGMISGPSRDDLNSFFWRQVVANSPNEARPAHAYEQGWNALNELIRSDGTWSGYERNVFYANNRDGTFSDVSGIVGLDFLEDGRAFAFADFDHDGRLEVFLKNRNSPQLRVLKNVARDLPPSITFRLRGGKSNPDAIGASVTLETESGRQTRTLQAGSGFLSQQSKEVFFGLGAAKGLVRATIRWPSGLAQELHDLPPNHRIWVEEGAEPSRMEPFNVGQRLKSASSVDSVDARRPRSGHAPEAVSSEKATLQNTESFPTTVETWLLAPVSAPDFSLRDLTGNARTLAMLRGKPALVYFWVVDSAKCREDLELFNRLHRRWADQGLQLLTINVDNASDLARVRFVARERRLSFPILQGSDDIAAIYNILYRYLFDRHRDMPLPISFLISEAGNIVKVYQGPMSAEHVEQDFGHIPQSATGRLAKALPFPGISESQEFRRNYLNYGSVFFQRGYYDQADASFRLALVDEPSSAEALYGLGSVYLKREKIAEARESFERATTAQASYPETVANAWNNLGLLATREGRTAEAIPYFQEALKLSPDHLVGLENLGNAYRQLKRWDEQRSNAPSGSARTIPRPTTAWGWSLPKSTILTALTSIWKEP